MAHLARYAVGSLTASIVSAILLTGLSWRHTVPPAVATVIAFVVGALVNFAVFRFWAWRHTLVRQAGALGRDLAKFAAVAIATALIAAAATTLAGRYADHAGFSSAQRTLLIDGCYFGSFGVMFVLKFVILDRFVFAEHRPVDASRDPLENATVASTTVENTTVADTAVAGTTPATATVENTTPA